MYHIFYRDPVEHPCGSDPGSENESCIHRTAGTKEEAMELAKQAAASWRGLDRDEIMVFGEDGMIALPDEPDAVRCPHCGMKIDTDGFPVESADGSDYDPDYGAYHLKMPCPKCGETVHAWFGGSLGALEFQEIDEYDCDD